MKYNYYELLKVTPEATSEEIKIAYKEISSIYNPETSKEANARKMYRLISTAYDVLTDPAKRSSYDYEINYSSVLKNHNLPKHRPSPKPALSKKPTAILSNPAKSPPPHTIALPIKIILLALGVLIMVVSTPLRLLSPIIKFLLKWIGRIILLISIISSIGFFLQVITHEAYNVLSSIIAIALFWGVGTLFIVLGKGGLDTVLDSIDQFTDDINLL